MEAFVARLINCGVIAGGFIVLISFGVVGFHIMFIGGIVGLIDQCKTPVTSTEVVTVCVSKIIFSIFPIIIGIVGGFSMIVSGFNSLRSGKL
jgi:hypothetical protein